MFRIDRKRRIGISFALVVALVLVLATTALADPRTLVGERINVLEGTPTVFLAGEPFFIIHAAVMEPPNDTPVASGHMGFALEVDGEYIEADWDFRGGCGPECVVSGSAFNFPQGMAGTHTFTGHWYQVCLISGGPCENPMAPVDFTTAELTVIFE